MYIQVLFCFSLLLLDTFPCFPQIRPEAQGVGLRRDSISFVIQEAIQGSKDINQTSNILWGYYDQLSAAYTMEEAEEIYKVLLDKLNKEETVHLVYKLMASNRVENGREIDYAVVREYLDRYLKMSPEMDTCEQLGWKIEAPLIYLKADKPNYEAAHILLDQLILEAEKQECYDVFLKARNYLAERIYEKRGMVVKSLEIQRRSMEIVDSLKLAPSAHAFVNLKLGHLYFYMENYRAALTHYLATYKHHREQGRRDYTVVSNINNIARCYGKVGELERALEYFDLALQTNADPAFAIEAWRRAAWVGILNGNIGDVYFEKGRYEEAIPLLRKDVSLTSNVHSRVSHLISQNRLAITLFRTGATTEGKALLDSALIAYSISQPVFNRESNHKTHDKVRLELLEARISYLKNMHRYDSAFKLLEGYNRMRDSIETIKRDQKLRWIDTQLQIEAERRENTSLKATLYSNERLLYGSAAFILVLLIAIVIAYKYYRSVANIRAEINARLRAEINEQNERGKRKEVEEHARQQVQQLQSERMEEELSLKQRELALYTHRLVEKNQQLHKILGELQKQPPVNQLAVGMIKHELEQDADWENYQQVFEQIHPDFFSRLKQDYPQLTQTDLRYAAYVKMGLSTKEIAAMLNVNAESLKNTRYRMRKKIGLDMRIRVNDFIVTY